MMEVSPPHSPTLKGAKKQEEHHQRDYSTVSALTDVSVDDDDDLARAVRAASIVENEEQHETVMPVMPKRTSAEKLRLMDLDEAGPLETEAETSILKALEEKEEKRGARPPTGASILKHVPNQGVESLVQNTNDADKKSKRPTMTKGSRTKRRSSIEMPPANENLNTELAQLTSAMEDIRGDDASADDKHRARPQTPTLRGGLTSPESLMGNAEILIAHGSALKRRQGFRKLQTSSTADNVESTRPKSRWNLFRTSNGQSSEQETDPEIGHVQDTDKKRKLWKRPVARLKYTNINEFLRKKWPWIRRYILITIFYIILPLLGIAALFFNSTSPPGPTMRNRETTVAYMFNFVVRHVVIVSLVLLTQLVFIDIIAMRTRLIVRVFGQLVTLVLIQSHGMPFVVFFWALFASALTTGHNEFAKHWLYMQDRFPIYTAANPDGGLTTEQTYHDVLNGALFFGIAVLVKRILVGVYMGKRTYFRYGDKLADVMREMILVSEVAVLAQGIEDGLSGSELGYRESSVSFSIPLDIDDDDDEDSVTLVNVSSSETNLEGQGVIDPDAKHSMTGDLTLTQRIKIRDLLGDWEEPKRERKEEKKADIRSVLQFRQALQLTDVDYPFSRAFGLADSRETCIESSQQVYMRLVSNTDTKVLQFDTIAVLGTTETGDVDKEKMKELIRLFRPDRDGKLSMLDFVRSTDGVYKSMRLLRASVENSSQIDRAFETVINVCFYILLFVVIVAIMGFNPMSMVLSISSLIVGFAFAISSASSKAFEGILFVLLRRPFDIGDRIHVSPVDQDTSRDGSSTWFVEKVDLFTTTLRFATTNEVATSTNGSMANSRIINAARSKNPVTYVFMKFGVDVTYKKVKIFRATVEDFVKQRPRQFRAMNGFRATRVEQDLGFIEYVIVLQHRGSWQDVGPILTSKAEFSSFALEVSKKLEMRYKPPRLSVDVDMTTDKESKAEAASKPEGDRSDARASDRIPQDMAEVAALFSAAKG